MIIQTHSLLLPYMCSTAEHTKRRERHAEPNARDGESCTARSTSDEISMLTCHVTDKCLHTSTEPLLKVRVLTSDGTMDTVHAPSQNALSDCVLECFLAAGRLHAPPPSASRRE